MLKEKLIKKQPFDGKIAILTGASKGMGKATAKEIVQLGGSVCIVARTVETLQKAVKEIEALKVNDEQFVEMISCDTTNMEQLNPLLTEFVEKYRVPDYLFNFVGFARPQYVEKIPLEDFKEHIEINYYGQLIPILIMLPFFMKAKKGYITNVSSVGGFLGFIGYANYSPAKFAIVGLTETLRHELKPYNINFSVVYPPDTDTDALIEENKTKPEECAIISERGRLISPEMVAEVLIEGVLKNKFEIPVKKAKLYWRIYRHFPKLLRWIGDRDLKKARKKLGKD